MDFVDDPIGGLETFQLMADIVINPIDVGEGILIDLDSLHEIRSPSVSR